jgi:DNA-binding Xre family transcriptional regulator
MIRLRVQEKARDRGILTITALAEEAGLAYDTARDLWHGRMQRIDRDVLSRVCAALQVQPGDLLEWEPNGDEKIRVPDLALAV